MSLNPVVLYDISGQQMAVLDGVAIPASTYGLLHLGKDENGLARVPIVESKVQAPLSMDVFTYGARYSPANVAFTSAAVYTRNLWGTVATSATSQVTITEANTIVGVLTSTAAATASFKVVSTSANDASAGTGVRTIRIVYIGTDGLRYSVSATMNGLTVVTVSLSPSAIGVQEVYSTSFGSGQATAGTITVKNTGSTTTLGQITASRTGTRSTIHLVPNGKTCYLRGIRFSSRVVASLMTIRFALWDYSTGATVNQLDVDSFRSIISGSTLLTFDPPLALKPESNQIGTLSALISPDAVTAANHYCAFDLMEM